MKYYSRCIIITTLISRIFAVHPYYKMQPVKFFQLVGKNIKTSLSPQIHNRLFQIKNRPYLYTLHPQNILPDLKQSLADPCFGGLSITIPFKRSYQDKRQEQEELAVLCYRGSFAEKTKIINTVVQGEGRELFGYNTDIFGIQQVLSTYSVPALVENQYTKKENVLIFGAGATSETFCQYFQNWSLINNIFIINRTEQKIPILQKKYPKIKHFSEQLNSPNISLFINTLPTQIMKKQKDSYKKMIKNIPNGLSIQIMDVNYRDKQQHFQNMLLENDNKFSITKKYSGLDMLIWQAIEQNRIFCQQQPESPEKQRQYYAIIKRQIE